MSDKIERTKIAQETIDALLWYDVCAACWTLRIREDRLSREFIQRIVEKIADKGGS